MSMADIISWDRSHQRTDVKRRSYLVSRFQTRASRFTRYDFTVLTAATQAFA